MREDIPQGTLDMLILRTLATASEAQLHGFEIASAIETVSASRTSGLQANFSDVSSATQEVRALSREIGLLLEAAEEARAM